MITVTQAERIVLGHAKQFGSEKISLDQAVGRVLAEDILADRDMPPFNRATMDGIAIRFDEYAAGLREFTIQAVQAAGDSPLKALPSSGCVQIMTGAAVPRATDTIIPIEDTSLKHGSAKVTSRAVTKGQYIHAKGADKAAGSTLLMAGHVLSPASLAIAAATGLQTLPVRTLPKVAIVTTGNELVSIDSQPSDYQIRQSNNYALQAALAPYGVAADMFHLPDAEQPMRRQLQGLINNYDLVIVSGGVSKGLFDFIPKVMANLSVDTLFHGVKQRPGKPFWFGEHVSGSTVFALPGNPVSAFLCFYKYVIPWLQASLGMASPTTKYAVLNQDIHFPPPLHYFLQVRLKVSNTGTVYATPITHNGSGDFLSLVHADAFLDLPPNRTVFKMGDSFKIIALRPIL